MSTVSEKSEISPVDQKVYHMPIGQFFLAFIILAFGVAFLGGTIWGAFTGTLDTLGSTSLLIGGFLFFILTLLIFLMLIQTRLITSPDGIEYQGPGLTIYSTWDNIMGVGRALVGRDEVDALISAEPVVKTSFWLTASKAIAPAARVVQLSSMEQENSMFQRWMERQRIEREYRYMRNQNTEAIPVGFFVRKWQNSSLGADILHYAPQLHSDLRSTTADGTGQD